MTNYDEILSALIEIGYKGCFTMEADNVYYGFRYLRAHPEAQKYGSRFAVPPLKLKEMSEKLLWETGKYILDTYGLYEE